jgi:hypothetical protein
MSASTQPGRNDRCPCGSGKKFKHCCLQRHDHDDALRVRLRAAEGRVVDQTLAFAAQRWPAELLDEAWEDFWNGDAPDDISATPEFAQMFVPWFACGYVPDPYRDCEDLGKHDVEADLGELDRAGRAAGNAWPTRPLALEWAAAQGSRLGALDRQFAEAACRSPLSVFVVETVDPGRWLDLRDVLTGTRFHVLEASASRSLRVADLMFARVVTIDGVSVMFGAAPVAVPADWHTWIIDWRERVRKRRTWTRADLDDYEIEIRDLYIHIRDHLLNPRPPRLQNTDGDPLEPTTLTFDFAMPVDEAFERLLPLATVGDERHASEVEHDAAGAMTHAVMSWVKAGNRKHAAWDNTILGTLTVDRGTLVAEVNSSKRANRLLREIRARLGKAARLVDRSVHDIEADLDERRRARERGEDVEPLGGPDRVADPELQALEDEMMRRHWAAWLDERVPALGNKTPRQAARSERGRERLAALLGAFDQRAASESEAVREALRDVRRQLKMSEPECHVNGVRPPSREWGQTPRS